MGSPRGAAAACLWALGAALMAAPGAALNATVRGRQILVDGEPMHLKGVNWNPVQQGLTHPAGLAYRDWVEIDGHWMSQAGMNVLRTYEPLTDIVVLDALWERRIQVINTIYTNAHKPLEAVAEMVNSVKHHPAILMWSIGNEWNYNNCYSKLGFDFCLERVKEAVRLVKQNDTAHPVASVYGEVPTADVFQRLSEVDVWGINYYDELSFLDLFDRYAALSEKPMFLGEYGADAYDGRGAGREDHGAQAHATAVLTQEIVDNSVVLGGVCSGGIIFELADEWWKDGQGSPQKQDVGGIAPGGGPHPDRIFNEEWWGLLDIGRNPRQAFHAFANIPVPNATEAEGVLHDARRSCTAAGCTLIRSSQARSGCKPGAKAAPAAANGEVDASAAPPSNATGVPPHRRLGVLV